MKRFTKIALTLAVIFTVIGFACVIISMALGLTWGRFSNMVKDGKFSFGFDNDISLSWKEEDTIQDIKDVRDMEIEVGAGKLEVYYADVEKIQVKQEGVKKFSCYVEDGTLYIEGNNNLWKSRSVGKIVVQIPKDIVFDEVDMEIGAGQATIKDLAANSVNIEVGAGEAHLTSLDTKELDASTGAGSLYVELIDSETDYSYDAECDIGQIMIGKTSIGGFGGSRNVENPGARKYMDLECGIGQIEIKFQK